MLLSILLLVTTPVLSFLKFLVSIRLELSTKELLERVDAEVAAYDQKKINHSISPMDNPSQRPFFLFLNF